MAWGDTPHRPRGCYAARRPGVRLWGLSGGEGLWALGRGAGQEGDAGRVALAGIEGFGPVTGFRGGLNAILGGGVAHGHHQLSERVRELRADVQRGMVLFADDDLHRLLANAALSGDGEGELAGQHFVEHHAERVDVPVRGVEDVGGDPLRRRRVGPPGDQ